LHKIPPLFLVKTPDKSKIGVFCPNRRFDDWFSFFFQNLRRQKGAKNPPPL
jgi:hypothetical protein